MQHKYACRSATGGDGNKGRIVTVSLPAPYEGIGNALRKTYSPLRGGLPDDMMALLNKLDQR